MKEELVNWKNLQMKHLLLPLLLLFACLSVACNKSSESRCDKLRESMLNNDKEAVKEAITGYINGLTSQKYTAKNLDKLVDLISRQCGIRAESLCFDCIETLPSQSEVLIKFSSPTLKKVIDISYNPDNTMKFVNMHE